MNTSVDEERGLLLVESSAGQTSEQVSYQTEPSSPPPYEQISDESSSESDSLNHPRGINRGHLLLLVVAILYGTLNVTLRGVYALPDPPSASALSAIRGWLAVLCFGPFFLAASTTRTRTRTNDDNSPSVSLLESTSSLLHQDDNKQRALWKAALELATYNFLSQGLSNLALIYVESARTAFLVQLSVVMTPLLAAATGMRPHANVWYACGFALAGLVLLSQNDDAGGLEFTLKLGDGLCLAAALCWSMYLFRTSALGDAYPELELQALKNVFLAMLYTIWCIAETLYTKKSPWVGIFKSGLAWILLFYSALGPGTVADMLQQKGQSTVSATVANILLSLEPVFTAIFGRTFLGELTSWQEKLGGCLILVAAMVATYE